MATSSIIVPNRDLGGNPICALHGQTSCWPVEYVTAPSTNQIAFPAPQKAVRSLILARTIQHFHFEFRFDGGIGLTSVYGITARGVTTEILLGLNRPDLRNYRSIQIKKLAALKRFAVTDPEARLLMEEALQAKSEYSAFARALG